MQDKKLCYSLEGDEYFGDLEDMIAHHDVNVDLDYQIPITVAIQKTMEFKDYFCLDVCLSNMNEYINEETDGHYDKKLKLDDFNALEKHIGDFLLEKLGKIPFYTPYQEKEHVLTVKEGDYWVTGEYFND